MSEKMNGKLLFEKYSGGSYVFYTLSGLEQERWIKLSESLQSELDAAVEKATKELNDSLLGSYDAQKTLKNGLIRHQDLLITLLDRFDCFADGSPDATDLGKFCNNMANYLQLSLTLQTMREALRKVCEPGIGVGEIASIALQTLSIIPPTSGELLLKEIVDGLQNLRNASSNGYEYEDCIEILDKLLSKLTSPQNGGQ